MSTTFHYRSLAVCLTALLFPATLIQAAPSNDEPLDAGVAAFFQVAAEPAPKDNTAVGLLGLNAPVGQDFMAQGRAVAARMASMSWQDLQKMQEDPRAMRVLWNPKRMACWVDDYAPLDRSPDCAPIAEAQKTLLDNALLIARYREVQKLPVAPGITLRNGALLIDMARLTAIVIKVDLRQGRAEEAYRRWADQHTFLQRLATAGGTWAEVSTTLVGEGINLSVAEWLLFRAPQLVDKHYDELTSLLSPKDISRFNIPGVMRSEYATLKRVMESPDKRDVIFPNYVANRYYRYAKEVIDIAAKPATALSDTANRPCLKADGADAGGADKHFAASAAFINGASMCAPLELIKSMHGRNRLMSLLSMKLAVRRAQVADADVAAYVESHGAGLLDPFTGTRMKWDGALRVLRFDQQKGAIEVRL